MGRDIKEEMRTDFYGYGFQKSSDKTTDGQKREMKYCDCKKPKKNGGDNYCQICDGLIANLLELPVMQKIASIIDNKISELRMENRDSSELTSNNIYEWTACIGILNEIKNEIASNFSA